MYRRRFSIHFSPIRSKSEEKEEEKKKEEKEEKEEEEERSVRKVEVDGGRYEPIIVCYNIRDDVLEVRLTD